MSLNKVVLSGDKELYFESEQQKIYYVQLLRRSILKRYMDFLCQMFDSFRIECHINEGEKCKLRSSA